MADDPAPPPESQSVDGPQIGVDEWVARSGERTEAERGSRVARVCCTSASPSRPLFVVVASSRCADPLPDRAELNDIYYLRVATVALVFALLALGLNVAVGFAGLLDLGYIAYYGVGAYGYAMLSSDKFGVHWQAWLVIPLVVVIAAVLGFRSRSRPDVSSGTTSRS